MLATPNATPAGTLVVIEVALLVVTLAAMPPMVTDAPLSPVPAMVRTVFTNPVGGDTVLMTGGGGARTVNPIVPGVKVGTVTTTPPKEATVAVAGTLVVIWVALLILKFALMPPMVTDVTPEKFAPVRVTTVPGTPLVGDARLTVGAAGGGGASTVKPALAGARLATVTTMLTDAAGAVDGTLVVIVDPVLLVMLAAIPPMVTLAPLKFAPLIVTGAFGIPEVGETLEILGGFVTVPPHVPVLILITPFPKVTVADGQPTLFTLTVCAWLRPAARLTSTNNVAAIKPRVR